MARRERGVCGSGRSCLDNRDRAELQGVVTAGRRIWTQRNQCAERDRSEITRSRSRIDDISQGYRNYGQKKETTKGTVDKACKETILNQIRA